MKPREPDPFVDPARPGERDDPFAGARAGDEAGGAASVVRRVPAAGPLAQRDPDAPIEVSAEYGLSGAVSFDDLLRRAGRRGFVAGAAAGALVAIAGAAVLSWATSAGAPSPPPREAGARAVAPQGPLSPPGDAPGEGAPEVVPPAPPRPQRDSPRPAVRQRPAVPGAGHRQDVVVLPGLALRPAEEPAQAEPAPLARPAPERAAPSAARGAGLQLADVSAALDARRADIEACLSAHPAEAAGAGGRRFHLVLTVADSGHVSAAQLDDAEVGATALGACLVRLGREVTFPAFDGEPVLIELPLRLAREE